MVSEYRRVWMPVTPVASRVRYWRFKIINSPLEDPHFEVTIKYHRWELISDFAGVESAYYQGIFISM